MMTGDGARAALRPECADEGAHTPTEQAWWNESWYFDALSDDGRLGLYTRIGRVPNQGHALFTACIVGPDRPAIMLVTPAPLPDADDAMQTIDIPGLHAEHECQEPLRRFRVVVRGAAQAHEDHSAPLRAEAGPPIEIAFDLVWETDGIPYAWRRATRYEIPCRVSGTVEVEGQRSAFSGPGQRDHSWGPRDWFAMDWMWSALHLEDGSHIHVVTLPARPGYGVGYVQRDGRLQEIEGAHSSEVVVGNGLIARAEIELGAGDLRLEAEPLAFGAVLLTAPDGRTSEFPRAMCRIRTDDGRTGGGWMEWNRNQPLG